MSNSEADTDDYLDDLPDGCGCVEVWTALSERRAADRDRSATDSVTSQGAPPRDG